MAGHNRPDPSQRGLRSSDGSDVCGPRTGRPRSGACEGRRGEQHHARAQPMHARQTNPDTPAPTNARSARHRGGVEDFTRQQGDRGGGRRRCGWQQRPLQEQERAPAGLRHDGRRGRKHCRGPTWHRDCGTDQRPGGRGFRTNWCGTRVPDPAGSGPREGE